MMAPVILYHHRTRSRDGQSVHIDEIISNLRQLQAEVIVVEPKRVEATAQAIERQLLPAAVYEILELGYSVLEFAKMCRVIIRKRPVAIYERANLFTLSGVWASRIFRLPLLLEVNAPLAEERGRNGMLFWNRIGQWTERACWRSAHVVLPVTEVLATTIRESVHVKSMQVIANGVEPERFEGVDGALRRSQNSLDGMTVLGFVGFVRDWHGLDHVVDVLAEPAMANCCLVIVGDGPARPALERQAEALGIADRVKFTGTVGRDDLPGWIAAFDIALQPEVTAYASPLKLFEYMAAARAIVAPATPNIEEILVDGHDAYLYDPKTPAGLRDAIVSLAIDEQYKDRLGKNAAAKIADRDLTWTGNARRILTLVEGLSAPKSVREQRASP